VSLSAIRASLKATIQTVPNVGVVNDFEPAITRDEDLTTYFVDPALDYILGWSMTRETTGERDASYASDFEDHLFVLRAYRAVKNADASEAELQDLVELVRTAIRAEEGPCWNGSVQFVGHPQVRIFEARMFGAVLVHYCEVTVLVTEHVTVP